MYVPLQSIQTTRIQFLSQLCFILPCRLVVPCSCVAPCRLNPEKERSRFSCQQKWWEDIKSYCSLSIAFQQNAPMESLQFSTVSHVAFPYCPSPSKINYGSTSRFREKIQIFIIPLQILLLKIKSDKNFSCFCWNSTSSFKGTTAFRKHYDLPSHSLPIYC